MLNVLQQHISDLCKGKSEYRESPICTGLYPCMKYCWVFFVCLCTTCTHMHIQLDVSSSMVYHIVI